MLAAHQGSIPEDRILVSHFTKIDICIYVLLECKSLLSEKKRVEDCGAA